MKKKIFKFISFQHINKLVFFSFFYSTFIISLFHPFKSETKNKEFLNTHLIRPLFHNINFSRSLTNKVNLDLLSHQLLANGTKDEVIKLSINKEGRILGYKPKKLKLISYSLEKQIISTITKNNSFIQNKKNVYWLEITSKQ